MSFKLAAGLALAVLGLICLFLSVREALLLPLEFKANPLAVMSSSVVWYAALGLFSIVAGWYLIIYKKV